MKMKRLKIYIAGPLTNKNASIMQKNVEKAMEIGGEILKLGHIPFIPHLFHYFHLFWLNKDHEFTYQDYMRTDLAWLKHADALFYIGSSKGADIEKLIAESYNIPIITDLVEFCIRKEFGFK